MESLREEARTYMLVINKDADKIQGLVSVTDLIDHTLINLTESAPANRGDHKKYYGVGGETYLRFAAKDPLKMAMKELFLSQLKLN